jgi:hypothetical protein
MPTPRDPHAATIGANLVRAVNGWTPPPAANSVRCPWCGAAAGVRCVNEATGTRLVHVPAHHARYRAAGLEPPAPDPDLLPPRDGPWWARGRPGPSKAESWVDLTGEPAETEESR